MKLNRIRELLVNYGWNNYFAISALFAFLDMFRLHFFNYNVFYCVFVFVLGVSFFFSKSRPIDFLFLGIILSLIVPSCFLNYPREYFVNAFQFEILPMFAFFIGATSCMKSSKYTLFERGVLSVAVVGAIGLYFYFVAPGWYIALKLNRLVKVSDYAYLEMTRLSSFWEFPYWISYGAALICFYLLVKMINSKRDCSLLNKFLVVFFLIVVVLTQQRTPLIFLLVMFLVLFVYNVVVSKKLGKRIFGLYTFWICTVLVSVAIVFSALSYERQQFIFEKLDVFSAKDGGLSAFVEKRASLTYKITTERRISLFGDGLGLYSHLAFAKGASLYITDHQYYKMLYETGLIGFLSRLLFILYCFACGLKKKNYCMFPLGVILMELIAMAGANSLAADQMHNAIFWMCCGLCCCEEKEELK